MNSRPVPIERRQVFQTYPPRNTPSLIDVRDAIDATTRLSVRERRDYFACVGLDYDRVCQYHDVVAKMERCYKATDPDPYNLIIDVKEQVRVLQAAFHLLLHLVTL